MASWLVGFMIAQIATAAAWQIPQESGISGYTVYIGTSHTNLKVHATTGRDTTSFVIGNLLPGTRYYTAVQATASSGAKSSMSAISTFVTPARSLSAAELVLIDSTGALLESRSSGIDFGPNNPETPSRTETITIINDGTEDLTDLEIFTEGAHTSDFMVSSPAMQNLRPGMTTTFEITFVPSTSGPRSASLYLMSNDGDENPFVVSLSGIGYPADENLDSDGDGSSDVEEIANGTDPNDSGSSLKILAISPAPGFDAVVSPVFDITFTSTPGLSYSLECSQHPDFGTEPVRETSFGIADGTLSTARVTLAPGRDFVRVRRNP
jgi:Fibronectin type III domain